MVHINHRPRRFLEPGQLTGVQLKLELGRVSPKSTYQLDLDLLDNGTQ